MADVSRSLAWPALRAFVSLVSVSEGNLGVVVTFMAVAWSFGQENNWSLWWQSGSLCAHSTSRCEVIDAPKPKLNMFRSLPCWQQEMPLTLDQVARTVRLNDQAPSPWMRCGEKRWVKLAEHYQGPCHRTARRLPAVAPAVPRGLSRGQPPLGAAPHAIRVPCWRRLALIAYRQPIHPRELRSCAGVAVSSQIVK